jgi:predicted aconitase with swiveling domain
MAVAAPAQKLRTEILLAGEARGAVLRLAQPISFWGGVDPASGRIIDARHPNRGALIAGRVLCLPGMIGSSSASAVLLELLRIGLAPAALILGETDAILALGVVVASELGYRTIPVLGLARSEQALLPQGALVAIALDGVIRLEEVGASA